MQARPATDKERIVIFSRTENGHRSSYIRFVSSLIPCRRGTIRDMIFSRAPVFFLMIEDSFELYTAIALWRACLGRRTAGILMRPKPALEGRSVRLRIKRAMLKVLKRVPFVRTMTIVPFPVQPSFAAIADDWIYDFQLWDLGEREREIISVLPKGDAPPQMDGLFSSVRGAGEGKPIVSALGIQDRRKGFDIFARAFADDEQVRARFHFVSGGRVATDLQPSADRLRNAGGFVIDRHVSDDELVELYAASDVVWALYAADYDQASGILGRAAQLGIPAIVRTGSLSHRLCEIEKLAHLDASEQTLDRLSSFHPLRDEAAGRAVAARFRAISVRHLNAALGLPVPEAGAR
ncbi:hypothetical protein [Rhizobium sp. BK251]|uniref:hypothetical protein n=1 Tax=Rhizobium sp. BK251 TaxID=2512125 RepID=UPI0010526F62|nr:hypothetical protein [Rhizobium sp. BK251]TCL72978.1 glycosyltransferase involved in cell wall biosynthesis [Rhizobium sp. BK251]